MTEELFNRFTVQLGRVAHILDTRHPCFEDLPLCGAKLRIPEHWIKVEGDRALTPGKGKNEGDMPDCWACANAYKRRLITGDKPEIKPVQRSMF